MALQLGALRDALIQAGASPDAAGAAAEEVATYETRLLDMHNDLNTVKRDVAVLKWMVGFNIATAVATLFLLLHH
jgi:hypothetical protein